MVYPSILSKAQVAVSKPPTKLLKLLGFFHATSSQATSQGLQLVIAFPILEAISFIIFLLLVD